MPLELRQRDTIRIPLVGRHNTRSFVGTVSGGDAVGIGVAGEMIVGSTVTSTTKDQRFINCIPERLDDLLTGNSKFYVTKRPGWETHTTPQSGSIGNAFLVWDSQGDGSKVISAFGATNSTIYDGTTGKGDITGRATFLTEIVEAGTAKVLITSSDSTGWYYPDAGSLTKISDAQYPGNNGYSTTGPMLAMGGYVFVMTTDGQIWNSDLNDLTSWTTTGVFGAHNYPDKGIGLCRYKKHILAFGRGTIEFFNNVGNPTGSPLAPLEEATIKVGCVNQYSYSQYEDHVAWIGMSDTSGRGVYVLDGYTPVKISTPALESLLSFANTTALSLAVFRIGGKTLIMVRTLSTAYVYGLEDKVWSEWHPAVNPLWDRIAIGNATTATLYGISQTLTSGKVYKMVVETPVWQDDGTNYTMTIQTSKFDAGNNLIKRIYRLEVLGDTQTSSNTLGISWYDDDYDTMHTQRTVDVSSDRMYLLNCGGFRRRAFRLVFTANSPLRLEALELDISQGIH